jgi:glycyl-tRNA synthetase
MLQLRFNVEYDTSGAIGRRYRRADESGVPFCVTVDFDSLNDDTVTVRYRDSMEQVRVKIDDLMSMMSKEIDGF